MRKERYEVTGMTCSACSSRVEKCVSGLAGMEKVTVNLLTNSMQVEYEEEKLDSGAIIKAVEHAGYGAVLTGSGSGGQSTGAAGGRACGSSAGSGAEQGRQRMKEQERRERQAMKVRLVGSILCLIPMMYISMHHMFYEWFGLPVPGFIRAVFHGNENAIAFSFSQFLLLLPIMYLNRKYFINGFRNLFVHRSPNMDSLIALGATASAVYGVVAVFAIGYGLGHQDMELVSRYSMDIYFESAGMILTLITLGKYLETRSKGKTSEAIERLMDLAPQEACVLRDGQEITVPVEEVTLGELLLVRPGESVPVDGVIEEGSSSLDEAAVTGESIPVYKSQGDKVISATMNQNGMLKIRATRVGEDTTIRQMIRLVEEASSSKAPIAKLADKIAGVFVPVVITIALLAMAVWLLGGAEFSFALSVGIAVLVISCPCALGLATPVAIMVGTGKGAECGILIKSGEALETAHNVDTVVMDKTGTITEGSPRVTDVAAWTVGEEELLALAAGMEKGSGHPLAQAVLAYAKERKITPVSMSGHHTVLGRGIEADMDGRHYLAGNEAFLRECGIDPENKTEQLSKLADEGKTPLLFADDKEVLGLIAVADVEKESSRQAIEEFKRMHIDVVMLTGDHAKTAEAIRRRLAIPKVIAEVLPEDKERHIAALQEQGRCVAMIGDGINDAPALARADVGIAIGAGTDVAIESADAVLMRSDLMDAVSAIRLSKAVIRNIKQNLFWAFFYNSVGIPLAAGVLYPAFGLKLSPMFGAAAMSLSSVCVVCNALRLRFFKPERGKAEVSQELNDFKQEQEETGMKAVLKIEGMMCEHCKKHVEDALNGMEGVSAQVDLEQKCAVVSAEQNISDEEFGRVITEAGYTLTAVEH